VRPISEFIATALLKLSYCTVLTLPPGTPKIGGGHSWNINCYSRIGARMKCLIMGVDKRRRLLWLQSRLYVEQSLRPREIYTLSAGEYTISYFTPNCFIIPYLTPA